MSFAKAQVKRFNDYSGCAPPVGAYDLKDESKAAGGVIEKSERFKHPKDVDINLQHNSSSLSNPSLCSTPIKGSNKLSNCSSSSESLNLNMSKRSTAKKPVPAGEHLVRIKDLEMEIRRLLREKSDKDKELKSLQRDQERLEGRLNNSNAERSSCLARSALLEQEMRDAKRSLDILHKQVSSAESCGRKKEDKLREEVRSLQGQIQSKEREIQGTQRQIVQALLALAKDAEQCAKHSDGLAPLFLRLELSADVTESEDEEKMAAPESDSGFKQIDSHIRRVRRYIRRVLCYISKLEESGVEKLDWLHRRLEEEHSAHLQQVSSQLADSHLQHQQLQNQLSLQQEQHQQHVAASLQQRQEEHDCMQLQIRELQQNCEHSQQRLERSLEDHQSIQLRLQQSQEEHRTVQHRMQQERDALESRLTQEREVLGEERRQLEQRLEEERSALEARLQESQELRTQEVGELHESCRLTRDELEKLSEQLGQREARLAELENCLLRKQVEHEEASQALQQGLEQLQQKLAQAEQDLLHKQAQHQEAVLQLQQLRESERCLREELLESQEFGGRMQQQLDLLQQEELQLKGVVEELTKNRDSLEVEKETAKKELEIKANLMNEALQNLKGEAFTTRDTGTPTKTKQVLFEEKAERAELEERIQELEEENKTLDSSIRSITAKYQSAVQELEVALDEERKKSSQMCARFSASEEERQKVSEELNQTQLVNRDLMESLSIFKDEVSNLKMGNTDLKKQLEDQRLGNGELQTSLVGVKKEVDEERAANTGLQATLRDLELQLEQEKGANTDLQVTLKNHELKQEEEEAVNTDLRATLKNLELELEEEKGANTDLQVTLRDLELKREEEEAVKTDLRATLKNLDLQLEEEKGSNADLQITLKNLDLQLEEEKGSNADLQITLKNLELQLEEKKGANTDLQATLRNLELKQEEDEAANTDLRATLKNLELQLEEEHQKADAACRELSVRVEQLQVENKQHQIANDALKDKLSSLTEAHGKETTQLKEKCHSLSQEKHRLGEKHKEDLQSVRKALALDRQANDLQMGELNLKLERAQAFNHQLKEELKKLLRDNEKVRDDSRAEVAALQVQVDTAEAKAAEVTAQSDLLHHQAKHAQAEWIKLKNTVAELESMLSSKEQEMADQQNSLEELQVEKEALEEHYNRLTGEHSLLETDMEKQLYSVQAAALEERENYEKIIGEMSEKIQQLEEEIQQPSDTEEWKKKYEDLFARVEPFLEQLDAYAAERNLLVGRNEMAEAEMSKMMDKYAKLLGHQNQRQKIQYINKLKDEFMQCRKEKEALKEKCNKLHSTVQKLEKRIQTVEGRRTFEPSQAFKHGAKKEDNVPRRQGELAHAGKHAVRQPEEVPRSPLKLSNK